MREDTHFPKTTRKLSESTLAKRPVAARSSESRSATATEATRDHHHGTGRASSKVSSVKHPHMAKNK